MMLIAAGKLKHFGLSEAGIQSDPPCACTVQPLAAAQSEYSLFWRGPEKELLPALKELSIGFTCRSARFGACFLTGKIDENTCFRPDRFP